jgi:hypothetical protein
MIWLMVIIVFVAGLLGGTVNALTSDNGFVLPRNQSGILRPGWLGNALIGGIAGVVSWSLYGPLAGASIIAAGGESPGIKGSLTVAGCGGAILVGVAGARWLSNEVDKSLLRAAGIAAEKKHPGSSDVIAAFSTGSPASALQAAQSAYDREGLEEPGPELKRQ